jgi:hypothetical protein
MGAQRKFIYSLCIVVLIVLGIVHQTYRASAQSTSSCSSVSGSGSEINLAGAKTQQSNVATPNAAIDKNTTTSAILQPTKGSGSEASSYLAVSLPKSMVVTKVKLTIRAEDAKFEKVNGYILATGNGALTAKKGSTTNLFSPFNYCSTKNLQTVSFDNANTLTITPVNTNNKTSVADFIYVYNVRTDGSSLGISEIKAEGFETGGTLSGKAMLGSSPEIGVSDLTIFDVTNSSQRITIAKSDEKGAFSGKVIAVGRRQYQAENKEKGLKSAVITYDPLKNGNILNLPLDLIPENRVIGKISKIENLTQPTLVLATIGNSVSGLALTNNKGEYEIKLPKGSYTIAPIEKFTLTSPASAGTIASIQFADAYGETKQVNLSMDTAKQGKYSLTVKTREVDKNLQSLNELTGVSIQIYKGIDTGKSPIAEKVSPAIFESLESGKYTVVAKKDGYFIDDGTVELLNQKQYIELKGLKLPPGFSIPQGPDEATQKKHLEEQLAADRADSVEQNRCQKYPQTSFSVFWFCGTAAKNAANDKTKASLLTNLAESLESLRQNYGYPGLPQNVYIDSSLEPSGWNGVFFPQFLGINDTTSEFNKELKEIHDPIPAIVKRWCGNEPSLTYREVGTIKPEESIAVIWNLYKLSGAFKPDSVLRHEFGHAKDYAEGGCNDGDDSATNTSKRKEFLDLREFLIRNNKPKDPFQDVLYEDTYDGSGGHPWENTLETYAAGFFIGSKYDQQFNSRISSYPLEIRDSLRKLVDITQRKRAQ